MLRDNKGITLIALTITIIVLLIIATITIGGGKESIKMSKNNKLVAELEMVQHACLERYTEYKLVNNTDLFVGEEISSTELEELKTLAKKKGITIIDMETSDYYKLNPKTEEGAIALESLGLTEVEDTYIINYKRGIAMNYTTQECISQQSGNETKIVYLIVIAN